MKSRILNIALDLADGKKTAESVIEATFANSKKLNESLGVVTLAIDSSALNKAKRVDSLRSKNSPLTLLAGVPVAIKDNFAVLDTPTTAGSAHLKNFKSPYDATVVKQLNENLAIPCLKSNLDEFGMGSSLLNSAYGSCTNPWSVKRKLTPGGSSGASAVSVASGLVPVAIGSDTGGSVRQPASFCGVVGLKPTYGQLSRYGLISYASSMDTPGILSTSVIDAAILFDSISHPDPLDPSNKFYSLKCQRNSSTIEKIFGISSSETTSTSACRIKSMIESISKLQSLNGVKIGFPSEFNIEELDLSSREEISKSLSLLEAAGAIVKEISIPSLKWALPCYYILACAEASSNLSRYDGVRYGVSAAITNEARGDHENVTVANYNSMISIARGSTLGSEVIKRILTGTFVLSKTSYDQYYGKAALVRDIIRKEIDVALTDVDLIVGPTSPIPPYPLNSPPSPADLMLNDYYTVIANLAGLPSISIPAGVVERRLESDIEMLPVGIQFLGKANDEATILKVAHLLEQQIDFSSRIPDRVTNYF